jgi:ubiquinone/menaquinone biosynthesis C-methylase UbiE
MKKKLHLGCGENYKVGWINVDFNKKIKADVYCTFEKRLPFKDNTFDYIFTNHTLEHIKDLYKLMDELHRICKKDAIIEIIVPHFTSIWAKKEISHCQDFGIGTFKNLTIDKDCGQNYGKAEFKVLKERISLFEKNCNGPKIIKKLAKIFNKFNFMFNANYVWQTICERFWLFGFDEIYYRLKVIK